MRTKLFATIIAALMFAGISVKAQTPTMKIGYTDVEYLLVNLPDAKDIEAKLKTEKAQYDKMLTDKTTDFQKKLDDYQKNAATMSDIIKADTEKSLKALQEQYQEFQTNSQDALQRKQNQLVQPVMVKIQQAIDAVAKENGYTHVFNINAGQGTTAVLLVAPEQDNISNLVFKKLGATPPAPKAAVTTPAATPATTPKKN